MMLSLSSTVRHLGPRLVKQGLQAVTARFATSTAQSLNRQKHLVVALGGNALLKRGEPMTVANQRKNIEQGVASLAKIINENNITLVHGNGPQVGLLLLESAAYEKETGLDQMSLDVLDAETEGMIGYMIEQEMQKYLAPGRGMVTLLSQIVCDPDDPAMKNPTKFVGPIYTKEEADKLGLPVRADGDHYRRVVPSPLPVRLVEHQMAAVKQLTDSGCIVVCAGGGGIPVIPSDSTSPSSGPSYVGIEAVIDKDRAATMMGIQLRADGLLILTDVPAVSVDFKKPTERLIRTVSPTALQELMHHFPPGSMGPKVESVIEFVSQTKGTAAIGCLAEADKIVRGEAGTTVRGDVARDYIEYYDDGSEDHQLMRA